MFLSTVTILLLASFFKLFSIVHHLVHSVQGALLVGGGSRSPANPLALSLTDGSAQPASSSSLQVALPHDSHDANALDVLLRQAKAHHKEELQKVKEKELKTSQDLQIIGRQLDATSSLAKITLKKETWKASGHIFGIPCSDCSEGLIPVTPCVPGNRTALGLDLSAVVMHEAWKDR